MHSEVPTEAGAQVERARQFLRDIRDGIARHPLAAKSSQIVLQQKRITGASILRMSGRLDAVLVDLEIEVRDLAPLNLRMTYSSSLERLRRAPVLGPGASAFVVAHDRALGVYFPERSDTSESALRLALEQAAAQQGAGLH